MNKSGLDSGLGSVRPSVRRINQRIIIKEKNKSRADSSLLSQNAEDATRRDCTPLFRANHPLALPARGNARARPSSCNGGDGKWWRSC